MSTRGLYTFHDTETKPNELVVYRHWDNYPSGACDAIEAAIGHAWELPRFEADEFATAFIAANKGKEGGNVRLVPSYKPNEPLSGYSAEYSYLITAKEGKIHVECFDAFYEGEYKSLYCGPLDKFKTWAKAWEEKQNAA